MSVMVKTNFGGLFMPWKPFLLRHCAVIDIMAKNAEKMRIMRLSGPLPVAKVSEEGEGLLCLDTYTTISSALDVFKALFFKSNQIFQSVISHTIEIERN